MAKFGRLTNKELKQHLKHDEVEDFFKESLDWIKGNLENVIIGGVVVIVLGFLILFYFSSRSGREAKASMLLSEANYLYRQAQSAPEENIQGYSQAQSRFQEIISAYGSSDVALEARLGQANCDYAMGKYDQAQQEYSEFVNQHGGHALAAVALAGLGYCLEAKGKYQEAADAFASVSKKYPNAANLGQSFLDAARNYEILKNQAKQKEMLLDASSQNGVPSEIKEQAKAKLKFLETNAS